MCAMRAVNMRSVALCIYWRARIGGDDYQDLLPGHVLSVDHRELDCFRVNVPQGLAAVAIEVPRGVCPRTFTKLFASRFGIRAKIVKVRDKSHGEMLQVRVGRKQQNFPSTYDEVRATAVPRRC